MTEHGEQRRQNAFNNWAERNPLVVREFNRVASALWDAGVRAYSAQDIVAILRLQSRTGTTLVFPNGDRVEAIGEDLVVSRNFIVFLARNLVILDGKFRNFFDFKSNLSPSDPTP